MDSKPFSLQSPEHIAKEYGGNKQKIASAASMGLIDPTSAVMAGMFIDRMRSAQIQEQGAPQTVAEQVFAPPAPVAPPQGGGLAALAPAASGAPAPPMGAPPMGAPPMGAPPMGAPPMGQPPGMAEGGLLSVPIPDAMFDEPDNGGYAGGGIVAFAAGDEVDGEESYDELAGGASENPDDYAPFFARAPRSKASRDAEELLARMRLETPDDGGIGPKLFARAPDAHPGGEGKELVARGKEWGDKARGPTKPKPEHDVAFRNSALGKGLQLSDQQKADAAKDRKAFQEQYTAREQAKEQAKGDRREYAQKYNDRNRQMTDELYANLGARGKNFVTGLIGGDYVDVPKRTDRPKVTAPSTLFPSGEAKPIPKASAPSATRVAAPAAAKATAAAPRAPVQTAARAPVQAAAPARGLAAAAQASVPRAPRGVGGVGATGAVGAGATATAGVPGAPTASTGVPGTPGDYYGVSTDPMEQAKQLRAMAGIDNSDAQALKDYYAKSTSPEAMASQKKQDMWSSLAQIGFGMAGTNSPSFLQAAGQSASAAMPGMMQAAKDRKAAERDAMKARYDIQKGENQEGLAIASAAVSTAITAGKGKDDNYWKGVGVEMDKAQMALSRENSIRSESGANSRHNSSIANAWAMANTLSPKEKAIMYDNAATQVAAMYKANPRGVTDPLKMTRQLYTEALAMATGTALPTTAPPAGKADAAAFLNPKR